MQTWSNDVRHCTKPEIIAGRLTAIRNIYLRQELCTISNQIQQHYKERLPALHLVSIAAYEQVFNRRPLSSPEELRRDAVKYALKYYQPNIEKLRMAEARNGLYPNHDRLSCFDKKCPLHQSNTIVANHNLSEETQIDENQSNLSNSQYSMLLRKTKSKENSNESPALASITSDDTLDSITTTDTSSITASTSSDKSSTISTNEHNLSSVSTFSDTNISYSPTDTSSNMDLNSPSTDPFSDSTSNRSMTTVKTEQLTASTGLRRKPPKIIIRRPSDGSLSSSKTKNSSMTIDSNQTSSKKSSIQVHRRSSTKRRSKKKSKKYKK